jgi:hypothetical protein
MGGSAGVRRRIFGTGPGRQVLSRAAPCGAVRQAFFPLSGPPYRTCRLYAGRKNCAMQRQVILRWVF